ncbi:MAG: HAMP domain-containing sensor histidine kinase, partial [Eubacteriales bacterium]
MKKTLYLKFLLAYFIYGIFGFVIVGTFVSNLTFEHLRREKADLLYKEALLVANTYATDLYSNNASLETVQKQFQILDTFLSSNVWIMTPSGRLILNSATPNLVDELTEVNNFDPTTLTNSYYMVGNFFDTFSEEYLSVFAPITSNYKVQGYVVIHCPISQIITSRDELLEISYITFLLLFLLSLIILIFFTEFVYLPLRKITHATEQYASGNFRYELQLESADEIGYLAASLSYMASEIAKAEDNQKNLVANISHDFRSPLTSIKGYVEAMIDGTIPTELYDKYLNIVVSETERLTKLTNSLLTLNNLNTKGIILELSAFDLNQVIKNTVALFEGACKKEFIIIELILTEEEMYVEADLSKIQQVLYNLLDNAIKFSHHDSLIRMETTTKNHKLFVSIKDHGIGI